MTTPLAYEVPLTPEPQKFGITLAGVDYILRLQWNKEAAAWMLDIADSSDAALVGGIPVVTGIDLLAPYAHLGFGGSLIAQTDYQPDAVPTFTNLGTTGRIYFIPGTGASLATIQANAPTLAPPPVNYSYKAVTIPAPPPPPPAPAPTPAVAASDADIATALTGTTGLWYYVNYAADRAVNADGTGGPTTTDFSNYMLQKDHKAGNAFPLVAPSGDAPLILRTGAAVPGPSPSVTDLSPTSLAGLGGSTTGFVFCAALKNDGGFYNTFLSDVNGAGGGSSPATNGVLVRYDGDLDRLVVSVGTGSSRVSIQDIIPASIYMVLCVWYDNTAHTLNMKIDDRATVSAACPALSAGRSALTLFGNPITDSSLGGDNNFYGNFCGWFVVKNSSLTAAKLDQLRFWCAAQIGSYLYNLIAGSAAPAPAPSPAPTPAPPPAVAGPDVLLSDGWPARILATYYMGWESYRFPITSMPASFNVIYLYNVRIATDGTASYPFTDMTIAMMQTVVNRGQKFILTIGGTQFTFANRTQSTTFLTSLRTIIDTQMGGLVAGIEWDINPGKTIATDTTEMVWISQQLRTAYGANFAITTSASSNNLDRDIAKSMSTANVLNWAAVQYTDWVGFKDPGFISSLPAGGSTYGGANNNKLWTDALGAGKVVILVGANNSFDRNLTLTEWLREWDRVISTDCPLQRGAGCLTAFTDWTNITETNGAQGSAEGNNLWGATMRARMLSYYAAGSPPPPPAPTGGYPFGSRIDQIAGKYKFGNIVNNLTPAQMDQMIGDCYGDWVLNRLIPAPTFTPTSGLFQGVTISDGFYCSNGKGTAPGGCFSEGQGYAMLITVIMAGFDPAAKAKFDGLYKVARGKNAYVLSTATQRTYLMEWSLDTGLVSSGGGYAANDGDQDIALALLMADRQWGSTGAINYKQQAINTIKAIKEGYYSPAGEMLAFNNSSRTSDYMIGSYRSYKKALGSDPSATFWDLAITQSKKLTKGIIAGFSPNAGLMPGGIYDPEGPNPRPDNVTDFDNNGGLVQYFDGNSLRNPMRFGVDYLFSGDAEWGQIAAKFMLTIMNEAGGVPSNTSLIYNLDGTSRNPTTRFFGGALNACAMVGAMCDPAQQAMVNLQFYQNSYRGGNQSYRYWTVYYDAELQLLCLIIASGNWWMP